MNNVVPLHRWMGVDTEEISAMLHNAKSLARHLHEPVAVVSRDDGLDLMLLQSVILLHEVVEVVRP